MNRDDPDRRSPDGSDAATLQREGRRLNGLVEKLQQGRFALGGWVQVGDYRRARDIGDSTADFAVLDMEHVGFSLPDLGTTLQWMLSRRTAEQRPVAAAPIVRIPANGAEMNQWMAKQVLDYGAFGILNPSVTDTAQIDAARRAMRYPNTPNGADPGGVRGALPMEAMRYWGITEISEYFARAELWPIEPSGELVLSVLVESVAAWDNIEAIVGTPGLGAVFWGPGDGSMTLGIRDFNIADPRLTPYRTKVIAACKARGVPVGTPGPVDPLAAVDEGFDFLVLPNWDESLAARLRERAEQRDGA